MTEPETEPVLKSTSDAEPKSVKEPEQKAISRQVLYDEIWTDSAASVAKKYEVPYSRFLKICRENNIPIPPSGYWTKLAFNKPVEKALLPESEVETIRLFPEQGEHQSTPQVIAAENIPMADEEKIGLVIEPSGPAPRYDREKLYREVWAEPMIVVSKRYGLSDNGLRNVCKKLEVPFPPAGHWAKVRAGKPVTQPKLPKLKPPPNENKPKTGDRRKLHIEDSALSFLRDADRAKVIDAARKLRVAGPGARLHKDIAAHKEKCEKWLERKNKDTNIYLQYGRYVDVPPLFADTISKASFSRAFHIVDALLKGMIPFGASLNYQFQLRVNGEDVSFSISESKDQIPHELTKEERMQLLQYEEEKRKRSWAAKPKIPKWDHPWNGRLTIIINGTYKFMDCKTYVLEDRIGEIMIAFYEASYANRLKRLEEEEKRRKAEEERRRAEEIRKRYNTEVIETNGLVNAAYDYDVACKIRTYIAAVKASGDADAKTTDWIGWASAKADWFDPTVRARDPYLGIRDHEQAPEHKQLKKKSDWE